MGLTVVTQLDIAVVLLLLISAAVGYARGAVREIAAMVALVAAGALTILLAPKAAPALGHVIHPHWLAPLAALAGLFFLTYVFLRLLGVIVAQGVQKTHVLGALDRTLGLGIGVIRGLVVLGALYLMFNAATPQDLRPRWITGAATWPLAHNMAALITGLAPKGFDAAGRLKPVFDQVVERRLGDRTRGKGYDARARGEIDDLVEKSR